CSATRKFAPCCPGLELTAGTMPAGFGPGTAVPDPVAWTARVLIAAVVPEEIETFVEISPPKATSPAAAPGFSPTGLPHPATRAIPTRSPAWTGTDGASATACVVALTSNGPRSARKKSVSADRRKNLIFTVAAQGALDQMKAAEVICPDPVAGNERSTAVSATGDGLNPKFGFEGRLPEVIVWADAAVAERR